MKTLYTTPTIKGDTFPDTVAERELKREAPRKVLTPAVWGELFAKTKYLTASDLYMRLLYRR